MNKYHTMEVVHGFEEKGETAGQQLLIKDAKRMH